MKAAVALLVVALGACGGAVAPPSDGNGLASGDDQRDAAASDAAPPPAKAGDGGGGSADASADASELPDVPELAACAASAYELHATTSGDCGFGPSGSFAIDGTRGTWGGRVLVNEYMQLDIVSGNGWGVAARVATGLVPGTYTTAERSPTFAVKVDGKGWALAPGGTFTIFDLAKKGGDQASLTSFVASFALHCAAGGTVTGCVRYGR